MVSMAVVLSIHAMVSFLVVRGLPLSRRQGESLNKFFLHTAVTGQSAPVEREIHGVGNRLRTCLWCPHRSQCRYLRTDRTDNHGGSYHEVLFELPAMPMFMAMCGRPCSESLFQPIGGGEGSGGDQRFDQMVAIGKRASSERIPLTDFNAQSQLRGDNQNSSQHGANIANFPRKIGILFVL